MHPFDRALFWRSLALTALAVLLALGVVVGTDEAFSTWRMRAARMSAFAPALAALGAGGALAQARARGELRALQTLGVRPWRLGLGPMLMGWGVGLVSVGLLASPLVDASVLFPRIAQSEPWTWHEGVLVSVAHGVQVAADGQIELEAAAAAAAGGFAATGVAAILAVGSLAAVTPAWVSAPISGLWRSVSSCATVALTILLLHAVAAERLPLAWLAAGSLPLAAQALRAHLRR